MLVRLVRWIRCWVEGLGSSDWPSIQGTISSAKAVIQQEGNRQHWVAEFAYWYTVEGEYYAGYYQRSPYHDEDAACRVAQGWEGQRVMVRYHPQRHATSRLLFDDQLEGRIGNLPSSVGTSLRFKLICGAIACVGVLVFMAYENVDFLEKHAPRLNAAMHNGEISDESDSKYDGLQLVKDLSALSAEYKGKENWETLRSEVISRQPYLDDLKRRNEAFQQRRAVEKNANLGTGDVCEQMLLEEFLPALNNFTNAVDTGFSLIESTPKLTPKVARALAALRQQEDDARGRMFAFYDEAPKKGCDR